MKKLLDLKWAACWAGLFAASPLPAQRPVIFPDGVVNAASPNPADPLRTLLVPGSIVSVYGANLASTTATAFSLPLPKTLGGTTVTMNGIAAPLFYVSPGQVNLQVPAGVGALYGPPWQTDRAVVVVTTTQGASQPVEAQLAQVRVVRLFTLDGSGCGRAAIFNFEADGTLTLNGPENSVTPGGLLVAFGTGLGMIPPLPDGEPAPPGGRSMNAAGRYGNYGDGRWVWSAGALFAGRAPSLVGVDQFNIPVPEDVPEGCEVPFRVDAGAPSGYLSQVVPVSIRKGGGRCVDPEPESRAKLVWHQTITLNSGPEEARDSLGVELVAERYRRPPGPPPAVGERGPKGLPPQEVRCPGLEGTGLDAGNLTLLGPGWGPVVVTPLREAGRVSYPVSLRPGSIRPGWFTVQAEGGPDVGPFEVSMEVPAPIQLTSHFPLGAVLPWDFKVSWNGGDTRSLVRVQTVTSPPYFSGALYQSLVWASAGDAWILVPWYQYVYEPVDLVVTMLPAEPARFTARGLTEGGEMSWEYEFRFTGLKEPPPYVFPTPK